MSDIAHIAPPFTASPRQREVAEAFRADGCRIVLADGAIRSGKTAAASRLLLEAAVEWPSTYVVIRETYRELEDSTKRAFLTGDGATPPVIPGELIEQYKSSDNLVRLKTGSEILFRSRDDWRKWLGLNLGGYLWDQAEESDEEGEEAFDALNGRLSDLRGPRKGIILANPAGLTHWLYRRCVDESTRDPDVRRVAFTLHDNADNLPPDYIAAMEATKTTRPYWYRAFVEGTWGSFEGAAFEEFSDRLHVLDRVPELPEWFDFAESLDHGAANPTAHLTWRVDEDSNVICISEYYSAGLISEHAHAITARRERLYPNDAPSPRLWADPSIFANHGHGGREIGDPSSIADEYRSLDVLPIRANHDRAAGYARMLELVHPEEGRPFPSWHPMHGQIGAPRLYVVKDCKHLISQLKSAPIARDGREAGECYDAKWANAHGHSLDSARYFAITRPSPSKEPERLPNLDDPDALRAYYFKQRLKRRREDPNDYYLDLAA